MPRGFSSDGPKFVQYLWPVINALRELGGSARPTEVYLKVANDLHVSNDVLEEVAEDGRSRFENRVAWARFYLAMAGLIDASKRGVWTLTEEGRKIDTSQSRSALDLYRRVYANYRQQRAESAEDEEVEDEGDTEAPANDEGNYRQDVVEVLRNLSPKAFEHYCQRLLRESGFQEVAVTGRSGDGGIDGIGILQINPLVSFKVLFQCKRYQGAVTPAQVRDFRGAMQGRADKGIILTTGSFTPDAKREALRDGVPPIELVDSEKLVLMMEELELGLVPVTSYRVNREFFSQFG